MNAVQESPLSLTLRTQRSNAVPNLAFRNRGAALRALRGSIARCVYEAAKSSKSAISETYLRVQINQLNLVQVPRPCLQMKGFMNVLASVELKVCVPWSAPPCERLAGHDVCANDEDDP